jgi:ribonuclease BN (tRNA processing enzyme)
VRLTVIGNSGSYPGPRSSASCYLLEAELEGRTWRVLLDMGNGALGSLQKYADASTIDGVFLSHLHADHCLDLCGYYVMRKYHPNGAMPRIPVWGPADTARRMAKAYDLDEDPGMTEEFEFIPYEPDAVHYGPFTVTARHVVHPVTAYALRVEAGGRTLAYSGDSGVCHGLVDTARDADLFLSEASFVEGAPNPPDLHLTGAEAGRTATDAGSRRLLLTHIPPWHDPEKVLAEAVGTYDGDVGLAMVGKTYDV